MVVGETHHLRKHPYDKGMVPEKYWASPRFTTPPSRHLDISHARESTVALLEITGKIRVPKTGCVTTTQYRLKKISNHLLKKQLKHYIKPYKAARV